MRASKPIAHRWSNHFPSIIQAGDQRQQKVVLGPFRDSSKPKSAVPKPSTTGVGPRGRQCKVWLPGPDEPNLASKPAPQLGLSLNYREPLTDGLREKLRLLGLSSLRTDLFIARASWPQRLQNALAEARELDSKLEVALQLPHSTPADLSEVSRELDRAEVCRVLVYHCGHPATEAASIRQLRAQVSASIQIGGGSDANFCELNREHAIGNLELADFDVLAWSINPQVHATDDQSVMETVNSLSAMVNTAKEMTDKKPMVISPITLRPRFNAVARDTHSDFGFPEPRGDGRQHEPIVATWMIAAWIELATSNVASTSWFETHGACGLFRTDAVGWNPVADAFQGIMATARSVTPCRTITHDVVAAIVDYGSHKQLVVANLVDGELDLTVECEGVAQSMELLPPYGTLFQPYPLT